ncbi:MAG: hypothetical protein Q9P14_08360 [candidate division KSB1 bacterium]|nr:hypothetical protein [candidate division KSB1 bacterium]MDQ7065803.1 hypothetical protein [candidate division KSB1 bacterium]
MKDRGLLRFLGLVLFWGLPASVMAATPQASVEVTLRATLKQDEVPLNRQAVLVVEAQWQGSPDAVQFYPLEPPQVSNLKIIGTASANRVESLGEQVLTTRRYEFTLQPEGLGMAYIDEIRLTYKDADGNEHSLQTPRLQLKVVDAVPEPGENHAGLIALMSVAVILLLAGGVWRWRERARRKAADLQQVEAEKTLEEEFLERLGAEIQLQSQNLLEEYAKLARLLRQYVQRTLKLDSGMGSTEELVKILKTAGTPVEVVMQVQEVLQACDVVKFSGASAEPNQFARIYTLTEDLIKQKKLAWEQAER